MAFNWTCPHCNHRQTVTGPNHTSGVFRFGHTESVYGWAGLRYEATVCANPACQEVTIKCEFVRGEFTGSRWEPRAPFFSQTLWPESNAKPQPDFIPKPIKDDYIEACRIRTLSPKASATLARRCMQGMIRDFCGIDERTLHLQINTLERLNDEGNAPKGVFDETIIALHNVRKIGNIGAHMEKDINLIVDVDPNEATILIELIETLFEEWYVARHQREQRFSKLNEIATDKEAARKGEIEEQPNDQN